MTATRIDLPIEGMTCGACAAHVGKGLREVDGVVEASVNFATGRARIVADADVATLEHLTAAVAATGYRVGSDDPTQARSDGRSLGRRLAVAAGFAIPLMVGSMILRFDGEWWRWTSAALATPVVFGSGFGFHRAAIVNLRHRNTTMDTLVSLGTVSAWSWSVVALVFIDAGHLYFETAAAIIVLILLGRWLEARARHRAGDAIRRLVELRPDTTVLADGREIPIDHLVPGDRFLVEPGGRIATDGVVVEGRSAVDTSMVTGEPVPVEVEPGAEVVGATVNTTGSLVVEATRVGSDTVLSQVIHLVEEAQGSRAPVQAVVDRISAVFVPVIVVIAVGTLAVWLLTGHSAEDAFTASVAVLIIACPCALGLATPTALIAGTGRGAQLGILVKGAEVLERVRGIDVVLLDKTGTLTEGRMQVSEVIPADGVDEDLLVARAAAVEARSEHPIAAAVAELVSTPAPAHDLVAAPGFGVSGHVDGAIVTIGRPSLFEPLPPELATAAEQALAAGHTVVAAGWDDAAQGLFVVTDTVRPTSAEAVARLRSMGIEVTMVTGDDQRTADTVGRLLGVDQVIGGVLPEDKILEVRRHQDAGRQVAMVGDGINDAPALAQADLGIAVGTGTDIAVEAADVAIMTGDPLAIVDAIDLSRRTLATIHGNLFWAFAYNVAAVPLAAAGVLSPAIAAGAMAFSSVFVVTNSLRLRRFRPSRGMTSGRDLHSD